MASTIRFTLSDMEDLADGFHIYELIDGEIHVSTQPSWHHQIVTTRLLTELEVWSRHTGLGVTNNTPGVILSNEDAVAPDVVWVSHERLARLLREDDRLHGTPDLAVEVVSPGASNERRDREAKLKLYSVYGVREYWLVEWQTREVHVYRRMQGVPQLSLVQTLGEGDMLTSPMLPGFACELALVFGAASGLPPAAR